MLGWMARGPSCRSLRASQPTPPFLLRSCVVSNVQHTHDNISLARSISQHILAIIVSFDHGDARILLLEAIRDTTKQGCQIILRVRVGDSIKNYLSISFTTITPDYLNTSLPVPPMYPVPPVLFASSAATHSCPEPLGVSLHEDLGIHAGAELLDGVIADKSVGKRSKAWHAQRSSCTLLFSLGCTEVLACIITNHA